MKKHFVKIGDVVRTEGSPRLYEVLHITKKSCFVRHILNGHDKTLRIEAGRESVIPWPMVVAVDVEPDLEIRPDGKTLEANDLLKAKIVGLMETIDRLRR